MTLKHLIGIKIKKSPEPIKDSEDCTLVYFILASLHGKACSVNSEVTSEWYFALFTFTIHFFLQAGLLALPTFASLPIR
jgi:hypothetical protein